MTASARKMRNEEIIINALADGKARLDWDEQSKVFIKMVKNNPRRKFEAKKKLNGSLAVHANENKIAAET